MRRPWSAKLVTVLGTALAGSLSFSALAAGDNPPAMTGFSSAGASQQAALEQKFDALLSAQRQSDWNKEMASGANNVGTPHDKANAEMMLKLFQSWGWDAAPDDWHFDPSVAGTGALGDLGAHSIDLARHLVGEIRSVSATVRTFVPGRRVDDSFVATIEFANGATGTLEASRLARGRINHNAFELNGTKGSVAYDQERMNELQISDGGAFRTVLEHGDWWPPGHIIGWGDTFTYEYLHLLNAIAGDGAVAPDGATFEDGYRCALVCDAILRSSQSGREETP